MCASDMTGVFKRLPGMVRLRRCRLLLLVGKGFDLGKGDLPWTEKGACKRRDAAESRLRVDDSYLLGTK